MAIDSEEERKWERGRKRLEKWNKQETASWRVDMERLVMEGTKVEERERRTERES